jgi:hypothetical protein
MSLGGLLVAAWPAPARAQVPPPIVLEWDAPAGCPGRREVLARIAALRIPGPGAPASPPSAIARVHREPSGRWQLDLYTQTPDGTGTRVLRGGSCAYVTQAAVLILALTADAREPSPAPPVPPPPVVPVAPPPVVPVAPPVVAVPEPVVPPLPPPLPPPVARRRRAWQGALRAELVFDVGSLPSAGFGVGASLAPVVTRWGRVGVDFRYLFPQRAALPTGEAADFQAVVLGVRACPRPGLSSRVDLELCAGVEWTWLRAARIAGQPAATGRSQYPAALLGAAVAWRVVPALALRLSVDGGWLFLDRPDFVITGTPPASLFRPSAGYLRAGLGVEWRFP